MVYFSYSNISVCVIEQNHMISEKNISLYYNWQLLFRNYFLLYFMRCDNVIVIVDIKTHED